MAVTVFEGDGSKTERYAGGYDNEIGEIRFDAVSDFEAAHPFHPPGGFGFGLPGTESENVEPTVDFFGVPVLAPNFSFGLGITPATRPADEPDSAELVREIRAEFHDPDPRPAPTASAPALREIADVATRTRTYAISLAGRDLIDGTPAYHLALAPLRDPERYRLRELWVDAQTFAPLRLVEALNFVTGAGTTVPWRVTFAQRDGATYVEYETALEPTRVRRHRYSRVIVAFENVRAVRAFDTGLSTFVSEHTLLVREPPE